MPENALRQHHFVREDSAAIELAVAVNIFKAQDTVRPVDELLRHAVGGAGRLRHIHAALFVDVDNHRALDKRCAGGQLDLEPFRDREVAVGCRPAALY